MSLSMRRASPSIQTGCTAVSKCVEALKMSWCPDSNREPSDYKSLALPDCATPAACFASLHCRGARRTPAVTRSSSKEAGRCYQRHIFPPGACSQLVGKSTPREDRELGEGGLGAEGGSCAIELVQDVHADPLRPPLARPHKTVPSKREMNWLATCWATSRRRRPHRSWCRRLRWPAVPRNRAPAPVCLPPPGSDARGRCAAARRAEGSVIASSSGRTPAQR